VTINGGTTETVYRNGETIEVRAGAGNALVIMDESTAITWSGKLFGGGGDDILMGASRNDYMDGGAGNDALFGNGGDDTLFGRDGKDALYGGDGADILDGGAGTDVMIGGAGKDACEATDGEVDDLFVDPKDNKEKRHADVADITTEL
jgi:Ca2+-binding RTX toxin-like protein